MRTLPLALESDDPVALARALHATAAPDVGAAAGLVHVPGYDPILPVRYRRLWEAGAARA